MLISKLNRPESMNALNPELRYALSQHLDEEKTTKDIWPAVISGEGDKAFCAGMDLKHRALLANATDGANYRMGSTTRKYRPSEPAVGISSQHS